MIFHNTEDIVLRIQLHYYLFSEKKKIKACDTINDLILQCILSVFHVSLSEKFRPNPNVVDGFELKLLKVYLHVYVVIEFSPHFKTQIL